MYKGGKTISQFHAASVQNLLKTYTPVFHRLEPGVTKMQGRPVAELGKLEHQRHALFATQAQRPGMGAGCAWVS